MEDKANLSGTPNGRVLMVSVRKGKNSIRGKETPVSLPQRDLSDCPNCKLVPLLITPPVVLDAPYSTSITATAAEPHRHHRVLIPAPGIQYPPRVS